MTYRTLRRLFMCSASAVALQIGVGTLAADAADVAPPILDEQPRPPLVLSLEGGAACSFGDRGSFSATSEPSLYYFSAEPATASARFGNTDCGATGRIGVFQEGPGILLGRADYWGFFLRHSWLGKDSFRGFGETYTDGAYAKYYQDVEFAGTFKEERTVVDFEVGKDIGIGRPGGNVRLFGGLRYARNTNSFKTGGSVESALSFFYYYTNAYSDFSLSAKQRFDGIGPRLGISGRQPLAQQLSLVFSTSASALWGRHRIEVDANGPGLNEAFSTSDHGWVTNLEGEVGLSFLFAPGGAELTGGVRAEAWFGQARPANVDFSAIPEESSDFSFKGKLDRHNWGPFLRLNVPLGP